MQPETGIPRTTLAERVYETIKEQILDRALVPGSRLTIDALVRSLNVSSSPVREALARLQADRLVVAELYRGYRVAETPSSDYFRALLDFRIVVEGHCALIGAPRRDPVLLIEMRNLIRRMGLTREIGQHYRDYREFVEADARLHELIVSSARNPVIVDTFNLLRPVLIQSRLYRERGNGRARVEEVAREHETILGAFEAGDGEAARDALQHHLQGGQRRLLAASAPDADAPVAAMTERRA